MREITPQQITRARVTVPGSKSLSHRMLIAAALSDGPCVIENALDSQDIRLTRGALARMGIGIAETDGRITVSGGSGRLGPCTDPIDLGNSGTSMRLLTGTAALGTGTYRLTGTPRMQERPMQHILDALIQLGIAARSTNGTGCPPIEIEGGEGVVSGERTVIDCSASSQFLSALLLMAPCTDRGFAIDVAGGPVSKPYIDLTVEVMETFGIRLRRDGYRSFHVPGGQSYRAGSYRVEPDCSQAGYFWAAAAVTGGRILVNGIPAGSRQGDVQFVRVLETMGCRVDSSGEGITVSGGDTLRAVTVDMADMPDLVPTLAVVAAFARGTTVIRNVGHLRGKECDRLTATVTELNKMGVTARHTDTDLIVEGGGRPRGAVIETYDDHRMAMSFAVAGLRVPGVTIRNETCVEKSFPNFWEVFDGLGNEP